MPTRYEVNAPRLGAVDPGTTKGCALSLFNAATQKLEYVEHGLTPEQIRMYAQEAVLVIEVPDRATPTTLKDILTLRDVASDCLADRTCGANELPGYRVPVRRWKGNIKKPHHNLAVWNSLEESEQRVVLDALKLTAVKLVKRLRTAARASRDTGLVGDVLDSVGIGLYALGRTDNHGNSMSGTSRWQAGRYRVQKAAA